jgi:hypothetical protein
MRAALVAAVFLLLAGAATDDDSRMLFAVTTFPAAPNRPASTRIEPIARFRRVRSGPKKIEFLKIPDEEKLIGDYYRTGTKYDVIRGGVASGFVTVLPADNNACQRIEQPVTRSGSATPRWRSADAIAGKSLAMGTLASPLRSPSADENRALMGILRRLFAIKAVPADALDHIKSENVAATDLNGDGRIDFIGSFVVRDTRHTHNLFVVVMRDSNGALRADVIRYDRSLNAKDDLAAQGWTLVDVEDFDGDGTAEIIVQNHGWEWWSYDILKLKREAEWEVIYSGGGSGC